MMGVPSIIQRGSLCKTISLGMSDAKSVLEFGLGIMGLDIDHLDCAYHRCQCTSIFQCLGHVMGIASRCWMISVGLEASSEMPHGSHGWAMGPSGSAKCVNT